MSLSVKDKRRVLRYPVTWSAFGSLEELARCYNRDDGPEDGAMALALLLIRERTDYTVVERAARGTGIDYWLGRETSDPLQLFTDDRARLEMSGIYAEAGRNTVKRRLADKLKQCLQSGSNTPLYVVVVEFGSPQAEMVRRYERAQNAA